MPEQGTETGDFDEIKERLTESVITEDGYVYADSVYLKVPYEIQQYYYEGNVIYSRPQKK